LFIITSLGLRISFRAKVNESITTGIISIDTLLPIGFGQRQLILGDRHTGKTSIILFIVHSNIHSYQVSMLDTFGILSLIFLYYY
jgi:F0F1-type ATP synthase alpha subunit